jgi:hypothetical protein
VPKGSFSSHLGLCDPIHIGHYVLNGQHFEFLGDVFPTVALIGLGELDDSRYVFPATYQDAKGFGR